MIEQSTLPSRVAAVKRGLETISTGQTYQFESLITKISIMPGPYDAIKTTATGVTVKFKIIATPASGALLPLNLDVRYRVGFEDVLAAPNYDSTTRYVVYYRKIPTVDGIHELDISYTPPAIETVYFKVLTTGMDDYEITMTEFTP